MAASPLFLIEPQSSPSDSLPLGDRHLELKGRCMPGAAQMLPLKGFFSCWGLACSRTVMSREGWLQGMPGASPFLGRGKVCPQC